MFSAVRVCALVAVGFAVAACDKPAEPAPSAPAERPAAAAPEAKTEPKAAGPAKPSEVVYEAPASWQKVENPNPMRKATFKIPHAEGDTEDAEMSVSQAGGSIDANVTRWSGQFEQGKDATVAPKKIKVGELDVTVVEVHGKFAGSGMPGAPSSGPKENWALLGAIVETQPQLTFFKLTGPEKTIQAAKPAFDKFVEGFKGK